MIYKSFIKPLLFGLEAERAHQIALKTGKIISGNVPLEFLASALYNYKSTRLTQNIWGLTFRNPIGLAAGFDKNGEITGAIEAAGFGFTEVGSITANPSTGNPLPRAFRLPRDHSLINRMGLNNHGAQTVVKRLENIDCNIPLGINIAKTHDPSIVGDRAIRDYLFSFEEAHTVADYITVNISCPNTSDGKTFEEPSALDELLAAFKLRKDASTVPTLIKFSVDLGRDELEMLLDVCERHNVQGYVATNTSSMRKGLTTNSKQLKTIGDGGLSGKAITARSTRIVQWISEITNAQKPIIGVGGIDSFESALHKIEAGADLIQLYTGLVYNGPSLVKKINRGLDRFLKKKGMDSIHQIEKKIPSPAG